MHRFEPTVLLNQLSALPRRSQVAFALACAERLAIAAASPSELTDGARQLAYLFVSGQELEESVVQDTLANLNAAAELDDDVHAASFYALECCRLGAQSAVWAAQRAYDHSDLIAQGSLSIGRVAEDIEQQLLAHAAVQAELKCQAGDLAELIQGTSTALLVATRTRGGGSAA